MKCIRNLVISLIALAVVGVLSCGLSLSVIGVGQPTQCRFCDQPTINEDETGPIIVIITLLGLGIGLPLSRFVVSNIEEIRLNHLKRLHLD